MGSATTLDFLRYSADGYKLAECNALFAVTNNDGRWGIELLSSIMKPTPYVDVLQPDAEISAVRSGQDSMLRYTNRHRPAPDPETRGVSIWVYRDGEWGSGGGISQVTYHDRSNSYDWVQG